MLEHAGVREYLADMLSSFTRIRSHVTRARAGKGIWRRARFNDMDVDGLTRLCSKTHQAQRFPLYKRIADVCLFVLGVFGEYARFDHRYVSSGWRRPATADRMRRSPEDYEAEGRRAYRLAAKHEAARMLGASEVMQVLCRDFRAATKPLNFMSEHYLRFKRQRLFGIGVD